MLKCLEIIILITVLVLGDSHPLPILKVLVVKEKEEEERNFLKNHWQQENEEGVVEEGEQIVRVKAVVINKKFVNIY